MKYNSRSRLKPLITLLITFLTAFFIISCNSNKPDTQNVAETTVTITDQGCEPNPLTVTNGKNTFVIKNNSSKTVEWEILSGVNIIAEKENLAPGFVQKLTQQLEPGEYDLVCGLLSDPRGKLIVKSGGDSGTKSTTAVDPQLIAVRDEYKIYAVKEIGDLVTGTKAFTDAIIAGDIPKAQKLYAPTRVHWERTEPIAESYSDLDNLIDARADSFNKGEQDPDFKGFHRLEKALFKDKNIKDMKPIAEGLMNAVLELQKRVSTTLEIEPGKMVGGAAELIEEVVATKITGEEDRYSRTDLWDFSANVEGSQKIVELLRPLLQKSDPQLLKDVDANFEKVNQSLAKYKTPDGGFENYDKLSNQDKDYLKSTLNALAEDLSRLRGTLGTD